MVLQVQGTAEALDEGDRAGLEFRFESFSPGLFPDEARDRAVDDGEALSLDFRILGQDEADGHGEAEHPLADADLREDGVDEVGCGLGHSPAAAGATESALFAGKGDKLFVLAVLAPEAQKAVGQNPALEKGLKLLGDVLRNGLSLRLRKGLEGAVVSGDALIENGLLGASLLVLSAECLEAELTHGGAALPQRCRLFCDLNGPDLMGRPDASPSRGPAELIASSRPAYSGYAGTFSALR